MVLMVMLRTIDLLCLAERLKVGFQMWLIVMWRHMLIGALGDPNEVLNPQIHVAIFDHLVELGYIFIKVIKRKGFEVPYSC